MAQWTSYNPWSVSSVHDFWFLRCPECPFDTKDEVYFQAHAIEKHPASLTLFGEKSVKKEALDKDYEFVEYKNEAPTESLFSPEVHIKEELIENDSIEHKFEPKKKKKKIYNDCGICGKTCNIFRLMKPVLRASNKLILLKGFNKCYKAT